MVAIRRAFPLVVLVAACAAIVVGAAAADGGPSPGFAGGEGITGPAGKLRFVAFATGRGTLVESVRVRDGRVLRWGEIRGQSLGIPLVTYDGAAGGLSRDLNTLVLAAYGNGTSSTRFAVFDTRRFRVTRMVTLRGAYSFDALAPDGSTLYAIQYTSAQDVNRYRVRAYDLVEGRLLPGAIVDKREPAEAMSGAPMTRVTSAGGAWVYTLYARPSGSAFIHALDAVHRSALCIDLPWQNVAPGALTGVRMQLRGHDIVLSKRRTGRLALVDTRTLRVRTIHAPVADSVSLGG